MHHGSARLSEPAGGVEEVPPPQPQVYTYVCDVGKRESVYSTAEKVRREVGEVDILINNAGVVSGHPLLECPDELIERTMVVNCHAHFWVSSSTDIPTHPPDMEKGDNSGLFFSLRNIKT